MQKNRLNPGFVLLAAIGLAGCEYLAGALKKDSDAELKQNRLHANLSVDPDSLMTSLTRSSGEVLFLRLQALFPKSANSIREGDFLQESAHGLNRALAQFERPSTSLAQVALRQKVLLLCRDSRDGLSQGKHSLFSTDGILLAGESLPGDADTRKAFVAVRNAWLYPYKADSKEVQLLVQMLKQMRTQGSPEDELNRALCIATLSSAQFLMGNPGQMDAVRRVYLEIGRMIPPFSAFDRFQKRTSLRTLVSEIQKSSPGYQRATRAWHQEWLGLRPFLPDGASSDPRAFHYHGGRGYAMFGGLEARNGTTVDGVPLVTLSGGGFAVEECNVKNSAGLPNLQNFDPRTVVTAWEFRNPTTQKWEVFGGFVLKERLSQYLDLISAYAPGERAAVEAGCTLESTRKDLNPALTVPGYPDYYQCPGRISRLGGGFHPTRLDDFHAGSVVDDDGHFKFLDPAIATQTVLGRIKYSSPFVKEGMRVRRISPTGDQNGISKMKLWYSGEEVYVCNGYQRYLFTCAYRPPNYIEGPTGWAWLADYGWKATNHWFKYGRPVRVDGSTHPRILNQMRCGHPRADLLHSPQKIENDLVAHPHGFDPNPAVYASQPLNPSAFNDIAFSLRGHGVGKLESQAITRLRTDLFEEPYRLLNHILSGDRPYSELFTADYTVGHTELDLFYRSNAKYLPTYPPGYRHSSATTPQIIRPKEFPQLSSNLFSPPGHPGAPDSDQYNAPGLHPRRPAAGVLAMPAFIGPVGNKMRTLASRYFTRLLCGEPNIFRPSSGEIAIHEKHMLDVNNTAASKTAAQHLDRKSICYGCHVNLDPLGAALSPRFLAHVQKNEMLGMTGEMHFTMNETGGYYLGAEWGRFKGKGAFLGREVEGLEDVAETLVQSPLFKRCVVQKAFENVVGRAVGAADEPFLQKIIEKFKTHDNYNRLIQDIVDSPIYWVEN